MKKMRFIFLWCYFLFASAGIMNSQSIPVDTAQIIVPNRVNTPAAQEKPYVIMISADGFRYDYAEKYNATNLLQLASRGVRASAMIPSFPSITGPNHYTLITGLYPSHTGFVDNYFYDPQRRDYFSMSSREKITDGSWLGGKPLWSLAEEQGLLSASMQWVASNGTAGGTRPTYFYEYHEKFSPAQKVDIVVNWMKLPADRRPHFISLYFPETDRAGHFFGPESPETEAAVKMVDDAVGSLIRKVNALNLPNVNFIFVSDHGMMDVDTANPVKIPEMLFDKSRFDFVSSQTLLRIVVKNDSEVSKVYRQLKRNRTEDYKVYLTKKFPKYLHYAARDDKFGRIGQILLVPKAPKIFLKPNQETKAGKHGYNPRQVRQMKAIFYAAGDAFKPHRTILEFENVNVYPLVAQILGLKINHKIDGRATVLRTILKKTDSHKH